MKDSSAGLFLALDVAKRMGVAVKTKTGVHTMVLDGDPVQQFEMLQDIFEDSLRGATVYIEELNYQRNMRTVRSLSERIGYLRNSLQRLGATVTMVSATAARKALGVKSKDDVQVLFGTNTNDESDAIAVLHLGMRNDGIGFDVHGINITGGSYEPVVFPD